MVLQEEQVPTFEKQLPRSETPLYYHCNRYIFDQNIYHDFLVCIKFKSVLLGFYKISLSDSWMEREFKLFQGEELQFVFLTLQNLKSESQPLTTLDGEISVFLRNSYIKSKGNIEDVKSNQGLITLSKNTFLKVKSVKTVCREKNQIQNSKMITIKLSIVDPTPVFNHSSPAKSDEICLKFK